ncbi:MAG: hypothetical protein J4G15_17370 [Alphaproteobacteria bacterium]|nr:hypothetical protein [Alphaproteobacteria bacterium]
MTNPALARIAQALERIAGTTASRTGDNAAPALPRGGQAFVWHAGSDTLKAVERVQHVPLDLLC